MDWWGEIQPVKKPLYSRSNLLNLNLWGTGTVKFTGLGGHRCHPWFTSLSCYLFQRHLNFFHRGHPWLLSIPKKSKFFSQGPPLVQNKGFLFHRGYRKRSVFTAQNLQSIKNIFDYQTKWISQEWLHFFPNPTLLSWAAFLQ